LDEKPKRGESSHSPTIYPCPVCGGKSFTWGKPITPYGLVFRGDNAGFFERGKQFLVRECNQCGNVLWFTKPKK